MKIVDKYPFMESFLKFMQNPIWIIQFMQLGINICGNTSFVTAKVTVISFTRNNVSTNFR